MRRRRARFFKSVGGREPVRDWLFVPVDEDRKAIGDDIRTAEFGWPDGMPLCRPITGQEGLWEIRSSLKGGRIDRVLVCAHQGGMVLLDCFLKNGRQAQKPATAVAATKRRGV